MTCRVAFTFEYDEKAPETYRGVADGTTVAACARRAIKAALQAYPGRRWRSCVLLLERQDAAAVPEG